jgi:hypothetical protein
VELATRRLAHQRLIGRPHARPEDVVAGLVAVQSQDHPGALWAVGQRTRGADAAAVQAAFDQGRILRTHVLRPTWHYVSPADLRWLLALTGPRVHAVNAYVYNLTGLDAAGARRSARRIAALLAGGRHLTREELGRALGPRGRPLTGLKLAATVMRAELDALICSGPMRGKQHTYALVDERVAPTPAIERDEALARLAARYVAGHGPAGEHDLAWWSGLTLADSRRALEASGLRRATFDGRAYWAAPARRVAGGADGPVVHLLPNYDELLIAFKDRSAMIDPRVTPKTSVLSAHFVVVDGRLVGGWRRTLGSREVVVHAVLLRALDRAERAGLATAAARYGASLGLAARLETRGG